MKKIIKHTELKEPQKLMVVNAEPEQFPEAKIQDEFKFKSQEEYAAALLYHGLKQEFVNEAKISGYNGQRSIADITDFINISYQEIDQFTKNFHKKFKKHLLIDEEARVELVRLSLEELQEHAMADILNKMLLMEFEKKPERIKESKNDTLALKDIYDLKSFFKQL